MNITELYLALIVGMIVSLLIEEFLGVTCGGVIVTGYLSMMCDDVLAMLMVFFVVIATYLIVEFVLPKFVIIFGKRRFVACLAVSAVLKLVSDICVPVLPFVTLGFHSIGLVTPGIIANTSCRQGLHITIPAALVGTYLTFGIVQLILMFI